MQHDLLVIDQITHIHWDLVGQRHSHGAAGSGDLLKRNNG